MTRSRFSSTSGWQYTLRIAILFTLAAFLGLALTWANYRFALSSPGGSDFLVHYEATRALLKEGISPYSDEVALRIQTRAYGRPALPGEHELGAAYPVYSTLLFAPFALVESYPLARALWMMLLEVALLALAILNLRVTGWRPGRAGLAGYLLFALLWYHSLRPLINGNAVILVALCVTMTVYLLKQEKDLWAGVVLALATIKPQVVVLVVPLALLWTLSRRRWLFWRGYLGAQLGLVMIGFWLLPDWIAQNLREVIEYPAYNPPGTPGGVLEAWLPGVGRQIGWALSLLLVILLIYEWRKVYGRGFAWFLWALCLTLVLSQWSGVFTDPGNFIVLFLPLVLVLAGFQQMWGKRGQVAAYLLLAVLFAGLWALFIATVTQSYQPIQHPVMFLPLPLVLLTGLYAVRKLYLLNQA